MMQRDGLSVLECTENILVFLKCTETVVVFQNAQSLSMCFIRHINKLGVLECTVTI